MNNMGIYYGEGIFGLRVERRDDGSVVFEDAFDGLTTAAAIRLREAVREGALGADRDFYFCARERFSTTLDFPPRADVGYSWTKMAPGEIREYLTEFVSAAPAREARTAAARAAAEALRARREHCGIYGYNSRIAPSMRHLM